VNKHLKYIGLNTIRTFIAPLAIFVISFIVVKNYNKELWGGLVANLLLVNLISLFLQMGNKDHLVRTFSENPSSIRILFYQVFFTRAVFLIPTFLLVWIFYVQPIHIILVISWILGLFVYLSAESLIIYNKKYGPQVIAEIISLIFFIGVFTNTEMLSITYLMQLFVISTWIKAIIVVLFVFPRLQFPKLNFGQLIHFIPFFMIGFAGLLHTRIDQYIIALFCDEATIGSYQIFLSAFILLQSLSAIIIVPFNKILYRMNIQKLNQIQRKILPFSLFLALLGGICISVGLFYFFEMRLGWLYYLFAILFALPAFVYTPVAYFFYRMGREKEIMLIGYVGVAFNLIFSLVFVVYDNPFGTIIPLAIAQWIILFWYSYRKRMLMRELT